ncbi:MAG: putative quinol monooxygenase [Cyclobacteriaceae bacterium]
MPKVLLPSLIAVFMVFGCLSALAQQGTITDSLMVRIAELEIDSAYLEEYKAILAEEAAASIKLEPGVITILPMYQQENPSLIRILEIYASQEAYQQHLQSPHFQKYKTSTLDMVKSLKLVEMDAIDAATMPLMFRKLKETQ